MDKDDEAPFHSFERGGSEVFYFQKIDFECYFFVENLAQSFM